MKKILVVPTNAIGDTYLSMSAIPYIQEEMVDAEIDFLVSPNSKFLFSDENVNNVFTINKSLFAIIKLGIQIKKKKYDYIFSFFPGIVNSFFFTIVKSKNKGGFVNYLRRTEWFDKDQTGIIIHGSQKNKI